ncbi:MAG: hypothetical protein WCY16_07535 [Weeksellaceae bacterium]
MRGGNADLKANIGDAMPLDKWVALYKDKSFHDIINEKPKNMGMPGGPKERYVINPYDGIVMDMRHVMIVGFMYGQFVGATVERMQSFLPRTRDSAFNAVVFHNGTFARIQNINNLFSVGFRKSFRNSKPICGLVLSIIIS